MARYVIKRKTKQFGIMSETGSSLISGVGSGVESAGDAVKSKFGQTAAGVAGAVKYGSVLGDTLSAAGVPFGSVLGYAGSYLAGKAAANVVGSGMQSLGQNLQNVQG